MGRKGLKERWEKRVKREVGRKGLTEGERDGRTWVAVGRRKNGKPFVFQDFVLFLSCEVHQLLFGIPAGKLRGQRSL